MLEIKPIRVFLEVAERRSFAAAAKALRMTPASVTRIVARLETDLGLQLLLRTTRQVSLTGAGAQVAARYRPLLEAFDAAAEALQAQPHRGRLRINAPMSFGVRLMPDLLAQFRLAYPNIDLVVNLTDRLVDVIEGESDLSIRISAPPTDKSTIWRRICAIPLVAAAAPQLWQRAARPERPEDLDRALCLSYGNGPETWAFENGGARRVVTAGAEVVSNNGDLLHGLLRSGAGIAVLPEFILSPDLRSGALERVLPDWSVPPLWLSLYYPPYASLPPLVETFTGFFEAYLKDVDGFAFGA